MYASINASSLSAVILICVGGLMFVSNEGFFDIFAYGFKQLGTTMFGKKANANNKFYEYKEEKKVQRETKPKIFLSVLVAGGIFLIAMIVLRIIEFTL